MFIDRRLLSYFEWPLLLLILAVFAIGLVNLYSAGGPGLPGRTAIYLKQFYWFCLGLFVMLVAILVNYRVLETLAYPIFFGALFLLVIVLVGGKLVAGSKRWLVVSFLSFQPSEVAKLAVIIILARYFDRHESQSGYSLLNLVVPFVLVLIPALLILKEPDLGSTVLVLLIAGSVILYARVRPLSLLALLGSGLAAIPIVWRFLKDYQKERILAFLDPSRDPLGSSYHLTQSKIAVGSGQIWGKGFMAGTQSQLRFIPEKHTDFAFSVFAEEWGFVGVVALFVLYFLIIIYGLTIARRCRDRFGSFVAVGVVSLLFWQVFINVAMVTGIMPVVGIPLPLLSYGGSSLLTTMFALGLLLNISMRRFMFTR